MSTAAERLGEGRLRPGQGREARGALQSPDFFDAQAHPELTFASNAISRNGNHITIDDEITIKSHT